MKEIKDASHVFMPDVKRDQTAKFISFDLIRNFRNHFLINYVFQEVVFSKPTKFFRGEAEAFLLAPILQMVESMKLTGRGAQTEVKFSDESVANTLMKLAQNAANYSALMEVLKSSYYAGRQFSETILKDRIKADWELESKLILTAGKESTTVDWMSTLFGQQLSRKPLTVTPISEVDMIDWTKFAEIATSILGSGPGLYTEQRNISSFVEQRSSVENFFYGVNFPGFYSLSESTDAFYILALMYLDYVHVTSSPEQYQSVMRMEAPNTPQRMDAMATRSRRFMKYYAAMAVAPRFMSMYAKYLLMKDLNSLLSIWTDNELSKNTDMVHKMSVIEELCSAIVPDRFLKHTSDILKWFKDFYGVAYLIPDEYKSLADFAALKVPDSDSYLVKAGDPIVQSVGFKDKVITQKEVINLCTTRDTYIDLMYHACMSLNTHIQQIDKSVSTIQAWDEFSSFEIPTIPGATEFGQVKFASATHQNIVNDSIPRNTINYIYDDAGNAKPSRTYLGNVDVVPVLKSLVFGTIKPNIWLSSLRKGERGKRPAETFNPSDVRLIFTNDHTLYIGSRPMAHYAEMPIPVDYLAYADPSCVDITLSGLQSILQMLPSPYKALSDYFSVAASQFDMNYNLADIATSFAAVGFWFKGGLTEKNKKEDFDANFIVPACKFIYGVPTMAFYTKQMEKITTKAIYNKRGLVVQSASSDAEFTFVAHSHFPVLSQVFQFAQTFCDGFIADIPVLGLDLLSGIKEGESYDMNKFKEVVVKGTADGLTNKDFKWFEATGWSKYTAILPHLTFRVSSQSSALSDSIIDDVNIMKRFVVMAYANDKEIRPISRSLVNTPLVYIEPDDVMISRDSSIVLIKAKIADLSDNISKKVEQAAETLRGGTLSGGSIEIKDDNARADKLKIGHDAGLNPGEPAPNKTKEDVKSSKPFETTGASEHTEIKLGDKEQKVVTTEKKPDLTDDKAGDIVSSSIKSDAEPGAPGATINSPTGGDPDDKKKKKVKRVKADKSEEIIEVEADYKLAEGEEFVD